MVELDRLEESEAGLIWESSSVGSKYELNWRETSISRPVTSIVNAVKVFEEMNPLKKRRPAQTRIRIAINLAKSVEVKAKQDDAIEAEKYRARFLKI